MAAQPTSSGKVDRQTTTPFHLKLFYSTGGFHRLDAFPSTPTAPLPPHLQIYTWPTCTLRELSHLLTTALPSLLPSPQIGTRLVYRLVYPDTRSYPTQNGSSAPPPRYLTKDLGSIVVGDDSDGGVGGFLPSSEEEKGYVAGGIMAGRLEGDPGRTLGDARFVIGDWVECAIFAPGADGSVAPAPTASTAQSYRGGRTGEFGGREFGGGREFAGRGDGFGGGRGGVLGGPRENGFGAFRVGRGGRGGGGFVGNRGDGGVPMGEWRRGERVPEGRGGFGGRGRGRGY
ncbi:hypothetical protein MMC30_005464 [Trapelia coarctata]|nr:hypothetical protein [Trapelia coarctata]